MRPTTCSLFPQQRQFVGKNKIPEGSYEIDDINNTIQHEMEKRGHHDPINEDYYINISANNNNPKIRSYSGKRLSSRFLSPKLSC